MYCPGAVAGGQISCKPCSASPKSATPQADDGTFALRVDKRLADGPPHLLP
jgi:hypothetical protein